MYIVPLLESTTHVGNERGVYGRLLVWMSVQLTPPSVE